jgi:hypothetical protein
MAIDSSLLYWEMTASFIFHLAGPLVISALFGGLLGTSIQNIQARAWVFLGILIVISFAINFVALLFLQMHSCNGLKDATGVAAGAGIGAGITGAFAALPIFWQGLRLVISQMFMDHKSLLTPTQARIEGIVSDASTKLLEVKDAEKQEGQVIQSGGAHLTPEQYETQTFNEIVTAMAYMSAFAGAYGVGVGSRFSTNCKGK